MNWLPPTSRFLITTLHHVQRRSGNSVWGMLGADDMRHIVPELHDLVNQLMTARPFSKLKYSLRLLFATREFMV